MSLSDQALVLAPTFRVEQLKTDGVVLWNPLNGARARLPRPLFECLRYFTLPIRPTDVCERLHADVHASARLKKSIETLLAQGFLIRADSLPLPRDSQLHLRCMPVQ